MQGIVQSDNSPGVWGGPAYYKGPNGQFIFYCGNGRKTLTAFSLNNGVLTQSSSSNLADGFHGFGGTTPIVTSNGQMPSTGVVWAVDRADGNNKLHLRAYDANNVAVKLFEGECGLWTDGKGKQAGGGAFIEPTVINGKVYVGCDDHVTVFGL